MKKYTVLLGILLVAGLGVWHFALAEKSASKESYQLASITRGTLERTVSGTGTLSPVGTVDVGSQVSGTIAKINVDFNDTVKKGQLLAVLDTTLMAASVDDAEANLRRSQAQLEQAKDEYQRNLPLREKGLVSEREFIGVRTSLVAAEATHQSAQAALIRMQTNLKNAKFYSPIDGTVIERNVEAGQTVAASLQAPTLFVIAEDLARMEILGLVDESDIGQIKVNQSVRFTVQTYPDQTFHGTVRQIRLQPQTVQNVVNYTVVIDAPNPNGLLMPGMTATVDFVIEQVENALLVPSAALRIQPTQSMIANIQRAGKDQTQPKRKNTSADMGRLWTVDASGVVQMIRVETGVSDGVTTAIEGEGLREGLQVMKSVSSSGQTSQTTVATRTENPLMPQRGPGRPPF